jgi:hypothetical protein
MHVQKVATPGGMQGVLLHERLGKSYLVFGTAFDRGAFNAEGPQGSRGVSTVGPAPPGSFDGLLARVGPPLLALDLRSASGVVQSWLDTPTFARSVGAVYDPARPEEFFERSPPSARIDAVVFVAESTPIDAGPPAESSTDVPSQPAPAAPPAELVNPDFETGRPGEAPAGWQFESVPGHLEYRARLERGAASGELALAIDRARDPTPVGYASLEQRIDARPLRGARIRVSASIQLESHALGDKAFVFAMAETGSTVPYARSGQAIASTAWQKTAVEVEVPGNAIRMQLGVIVTGAARARIDDVRVLRVGP